MLKVNGSNWPDIYLWLRPLRRPSERSGCFYGSRGVRAPSSLNRAPPSVVADAIALHTTIRRPGKPQAAAAAAAATADNASKATALSPPFGISADRQLDRFRSETRSPGSRYRCTVMRRRRRWGKWSLPGRSRKSESEREKKGFLLADISGTCNSKVFSPN